MGALENLVAPRFHRDTTSLSRPRFTALTKVQTTPPIPAPASGLFLSLGI